jgi:hypothetical protein
MKQKFKNPWFVFALGVVISSCIFFLFPINLFDGEIVFQTAAKTWKVKANISLSYFLGIGADKEQLELLGVKDFYLLPKGYILALIVILGLPGLWSYRVYLRLIKYPLK